MLLNRDDVCRFDPTQIVTLIYRRMIWFLVFFFFQHHDIDCCINRTNIILKWILNFGNRTSLKFNAQKTKAMIISSKRNIDQQQIVLGDDHVDVVDVFKYLGVSIHKKLNWTTHIESVSKKALFLYHQLRKCFGNTWGLSFDVLKHIYIMAIEPIMLFACFCLIKQTKNV